MQNRDSDVVAEQMANRTVARPAPAPRTAPAPPSPAPAPQNAPQAPQNGNQPQPQGTSGQPVIPNFRVPSGGRLLSVNGVLVVQYELAGTKVYYDFSQPGTMGQANLGGYPPAQAIDPNEFYAQPNLVHGGVVQELSGDDVQKAGSFNSWAQAQLLHFAGGATWTQDPEMLGVFLNWVANPEQSQDEVTARVKQTDYWKHLTDGQAQYNDLSPASQALRDKDQADQLTQLYFNNVGQTISTADGQIQDWAHQIASGQITQGTAIEAMKAMALKNPESPWARTVRAEQLNQRSRTIDLSNKTQEVKGLFDQWGLQTTSGTVGDWATQITDKFKSDGDLLKYLQDTSKTLYPWKDATTPTSQAAEPWLATYARILERPAAGVFDPDVQKALQQGTPVWQFEQDLKKKDEWLNTDNAKQDIIAGVGGAARQMGFA